jgi:two-component system, NarL family, invasion response regulator UvrY
MVYRVLLTDDHAVVREGVRRLLEDCREIQVVAEASNGDEAIRMARTFLPDVAVIDLSMPGRDGIDVTRMLASELPKVKVLILTMHANEDYALRLLQAGAYGFVGKGATSSELLAAVLKVAHGGRYVQPALLEKLPQQIANGALHASPVQSLSDRELQVLKMLAEGHTGREIGGFLHLSVKTVDTYRARLLAKLKLQTTADLIRFALRHGVIEEV